MVSAPAGSDIAIVPAAPVRRPAGVPAVVRQRLAALDDRLGARSWLVTAVITLIAGILRLVGVSSPKKLIFDEIYYPTDAWDMLQHGVEWDEKSNSAGYVVHPPLGKWLIAGGELIFGNHPLGWRFGTAIAGTLMVLVLIRVAYRLFHSIVLAGLAGLLLTLDGFQLVLSRTSLLDIFIGLFILLTFAAMVLDRDHYRRRLLAALESGWHPDAARPPRVVPWWLLVAAACFGLACGVKWSALFFLPFLGFLTVLWRVQARRSAGVPLFFSAGIVGDLGWTALGWVLSVFCYLATWTGWFVTDDGYFRHYRQANGLSEPPVLGALRNLWHYHVEAFTFHTGLTTPHHYQSWPWQWLLLGRPVAFYWSPTPPCGSNCPAEILLLGTPLLWWSFLPALAALVWFGVARRDWRAAAIGVPVIAGLLPWFYFAISDHRTMFNFYVLPAEPFLVLAVVYVLGAIMTPATGTTTGPARTDRQLIGSLVVCAYVVLVALCFLYFWPIFTGKSIPYEAWHARMWLGPRWI